MGLGMGQSGLVLSSTIMGTKIGTGSEMRVYE